MEKRNKEKEKEHWVLATQLTIYEGLLFLVLITLFLNAFSFNSLSRSTRWPLGLLDETRQRLNEEKEERVRKEKTEVEELGRELRYTWAVVASELAGWQEGHERMARRAVKELVRGMVIRERTVLEGMKRALRKLKLPPAAPVGAAGAGADLDARAPLAPKRFREYEDEDLSPIDHTEEA